MATLIAPSIDAAQTRSLVRSPQQFFDKNRFTRLYDLLHNGFVDTPTTTSIVYQGLLHPSDSVIIADMWHYAAWRCFDVETAARGGKHVIAESSVEELLAKRFPAANTDHYDVL